MVTVAGKWPSEATCYRCGDHFVRDKEGRFCASCKEAGAATTRLLRHARRGLSASTRRAVWKRDGGLCQLCGRVCRRGVGEGGTRYIGRPPEIGTIDHVVAIRDGGSNDIENLRLACWACNNARNAGRTQAWREAIPIKVSARPPSKGWPGRASALRGSVAPVATCTNKLVRSNNSVNNPPSVSLPSSPHRTIVHI